MTTNNREKNNKSNFNDQTTCVSHSQSYFASNDRSRTKNGHDTTINIFANNNNISYQTNNLNSLYEDPPEDSFINMQSNIANTHNFKKKIPTNNQSNVLNNSAVPQTVNLDKVKMFIFYTKAHEN
jgi:hypothetical protein